jgi:hypothetical protein
MPALPRAVVCLLATAALIASGGAADAQSLGTEPAGYGEYLSLLATPAAGLPPLATLTIVGAAQLSPQFVARYGYVPDLTRPLAEGTAGHQKHSLDNAAVTGVIPAGLGSTLSFTLGISNERCDGCGAHFMTGVGGDYRFGAMAFGNPASALRLSAGISGELGVGTPSGRAVVSGLGQLPVALAIGSESGTRIVPFLAPGLAVVHGRSSPDSGEPSGARFVLGGGAALYNPKSALSASAGFRYIFVSRTDLQVGVSLSLGGR